MSLFIIVDLYIAQYGYTALHTAKSSGVVEALVAAGADVTAVDNVSYNVFRYAHVFRLADVFNK